MSEEKKEITIKLPFTYEVGEPGPKTGRIINTREDAIAEVKAELEDDFDYMNAKFE